MGFKRIYQQPNNKSGKSNESESMEIKDDEETINVTV